MVRKEKIKIEIDLCSRVVSNFRTTETSYEPSYSRKNEPKSEGKFGDL